MSKTALIYSGGSDSFTLLHFLRDAGKDVFPVTFDYGQRHRTEIAYAQKETMRLGITKHAIIALPFLGELSTSSALTSKTQVPEGFYADANMKATVVPNRNMILLAIAAAYALNNECTELAYGAHAGDHDIYPDCRPSFVKAMSRAFALCDWKHLSLSVPFIHQDKRDIYEWGLAHGLDYSHAWTCYNGGDIACGKCGSCVERLHAFARLDAIDPMRYADREFWKTAVEGRA
jgi:7-cyano-7-deazaguanine synthase